MFWCIADSGTFWDAMVLFSAFVIVFGIGLGLGVFARWP
jgi:hypothetical protein